MTTYEEFDSIVAALRQGRQILVCGNGGSAAMASHFAAELVVRYRRNRPPIPAIALNDPAILTAIGNDFGYENVFSRQVAAYGHSGDVLVAFSTSGKSVNVLRAIEAAQILGMIVIEAPRVGHSVAERQELQLSWCHTLAGYIEKMLFNDVTHAATA